MHALKYACFSAFYHQLTHIISKRTIDIKKGIITITGSFSTHSVPIVSRIKAHEYTASSPSQVFVPLML